MSKREQEKTAEATQRVVEEAKNAAQAQIGQQQAVAQEFHSTINRSLDETKNNVRKSIDEAKNQIPQYTNAVKNYQERALESTGKMVEEYVETQKSVIDSVFSSSAAYFENANRMFNYWNSPRVPTELWTRAVNNVAENVSAATRINNDILFGTLMLLETHLNEFKDKHKSSQELM